MKARHLLGLLGATALATLAGQAAAMPTAVLSVGGGNEGRLDGDNRLRGPGFEQTTMVNVQKDGTSYIVLITMQSVQKDNIGPWQCSCSSYALSATQAPQKVADLVQLTSLPGERACNHPKAATDGENIVWMYGSDSQNNRPQTFAGAIDYKCNQLVSPMLVSMDPNANEGAPDVVYNGTDASGNAIFTGGYLSTAGTEDATWALGLQLSKSGVLYSMTRPWIQSVVSPANIGRPAMATGGMDRTLLCASKGNNRPPEQGITCAWMNSHDGTVVWSNTVAAADPQNMKYMSQPSLTKIQDGRYALNFIESNGMGKNTNLKGSNLAHLYALDVAGDAIVKGGEITGAAAFQTHSAVCSGSYGVAGTPTTAVISASPTGIGRPAIMMVGYDGDQKQFSYDAVNDKWPIAWYGDSGHLANWYGRNPGRQGRDFMRCIGDVANPGHGVDGGYLSGVETFFIAAVAGRVPGDAKNSLTLSLIPGKVDAASAPDNPQPADQVTTPGTVAGGAQGTAAPRATRTGAPARRRDRAD